MDKTIVFKSCMGVFQGGGCRAAAFAGAYEEAVSRGVSFSEVAGTSAGSIVAALIGAGATPSFIKEKLTALDFKSFVQAPDRRAKRPLFSPAKLLAFKDKRYVDLYFDQGFYSSSPIQPWIDGLLTELLPAVHRPISFKSLPFPTYLISTDLARYQAKVWSQDTTPDELVSEAVRASCSIPIFFQPVERRYIDGGVLSNLPSFVFANRGADRRSLSSKVLAFCLHSDDDNVVTHWDTNSYLLGLIGALVDGATQLQLALQPEVHTINISTGSVKATDFDRMTPETTQSLMSKGAAATKSFFDQERLYIRELGRKDNICYDKDEFYSRITQALASPIERVLIAEHDTEWVYKLFPTVFALRQRGARIDVILPENGDKLGDGPYRRRLLTGLGVNVSIIPGASHVPLRATVIIPRDETQRRAIVGVAIDPKAQADSVLYSGYLDAGAIDAVVAKLEPQITSPGDLHSPTLVRVRDEDVIAPLRRVHQYANADEITISVEKVSTKKLVATSRLIREYKYNQIRHLIDMYRRLGVELFEPAAVQLPHGLKSIVTPPVVEELGSDLILIEGSTRATFCRDEGIESFKCLVVRGVSAPPPSRTYRFDRVRITGRALPVSDRYEGFDYANFRHIERAMHPIDSLSQR